jgi:hypothetical protein
MPSGDDSTQRSGPAHATKDHEALALGGKVVVVPTTLPCGEKGPLLTATAGTTMPGFCGETSPAKRQRFSLGLVTSVGFSPRSFAILDHETA